MRRILLSAAVVMAAMSGMATAQMMPPQREISVNGEGSVDAAPDMATIMLGVTNDAEVAGDAMAATSEGVAKILERLTVMGIAEADIQTRDISLNPIWNDSSSSGGQNRIGGFVASNMVMVRVRDLSKLGEVMEAVIGDGANQFNGLQFSVEKPKPLEDEARRRAVKDAMEKAQLLAEAAGVTLGEVRSITDIGGGGGPRPMMMAAREGGVPVAAGEVSISANVQMVFAIGGN